MASKATSVKDNWITARASTDERMLAEQLMNQLGLKSHSALVRTLINEQAAALNLK